MALRLLASCEGGNCPEVFLDESGDIVIKGYRLGAGQRSEITFAADEDGVVIPASLLQDAVRRLGSA
jgi:hypothetical protein